MAKMMHLTFWVDVWEGCDPAWLHPTCSPNDSITGRRYRIECDVPDPEVGHEAGLAENVTVHEEE